MKLPISLPFGRKEPEKDYYLVLLLRDEKVSAVILEEQTSQITVKNLYEESLQTPLEKLDQDAFMQLLDRTISKAEEVLPPNVQTEKTIFGVKDEWVEEKKIKKEHLDTLKQLGSTLGLKPIGFLVISEAIAHQVQNEEGAPLSGLVVELGKFSATITLFKGGKLIETHTGEKLETHTQTVDTLLKHFSEADVFPSRLLILNTDEDEDLEQQFITHQWSKSIPFLHVPQISILDSHFDAIASVYGAASQMGFTVISTALTQQAIHITPLASSEEKPTKEKEEQEEKKEVIEEGEKAVKEESEEEVEEKEKPHKETHSKKEEAKEKDELLTATPDNFGFVSEEDIAATLPLAKEAPSSPSLVAMEVEKEEDEREEIEETLGKTPSRLHKPSFNMPSFIPKNLSLPSLSFGNFSFSRMPKFAILGLVGLVLLFVVIPLLYKSFVKSTVTLHVKEKSFSDETTVAFAVDDSSDFAENIIGAKTVSVTIEGEDSAQATGKKDVGEKAKGTVTLYNNGDSPRTLSAGTALKASNNVEFVLDKDVTIASASGDIFSGTKPGTAQGAVTAKTIGPEGNLPSNTTFSIGGSSVLAAKNSNAFSGGNKKSITVVSKTDRDKLQLQLPKKLEEKAKEEIAAKVSGEEVLLPFDLETTFDKKEFDRAVDEEANRVTLTGTITFTGIVYNQEDIKQFALDKVKEKTSSDVSFAENKLTQDISGIKKSGDEITGKLAIKAGLLPSMDEEKLKQTIKGKSVGEAITTLRSLPQTERVEITFSPSLPLLNGSLPSKEGNITFVVQSYE